MRLIFESRFELAASYINAIATLIYTIRQAINKMVNAAYSGLDTYVSVSADIFKFGFQIAASGPKRPNIILQISSQQQN